MLSWLYTCLDRILFASIWAGHSLLRSSWGLHHLPSYSLPITLYLYFVSFWPPCSPHLGFLCSGFPLLLTSLPFLCFHLSKGSQYPPDFFTWTHHSTHSLSAAYIIQKSHTLFFCTLYLYHMVEIMSNIVVPNLQCVKGDCPCCKGEREDRMLLPGKRSSI